MTVCPSCGVENPAAAKFCMECATPLAVAPPIVEERKVVTTLFCDLVSFTALSEAADPEDVDALLGSYLELARRAIEAHGGTVEKYIGDAVVGVFGVPVAHEDDPERAVRAGLHVVEGLRQSGLARPDGSPLQARVGINTGEALVRLDVDPLSGRGFLTGDAVNTAARLEAAAPPMGVVVGSLTHELTERAIEFDELPAVSAKGKAEPVSAWLACRPVSRTGLRTSGEAAGPFLGRRDELGVLEHALSTAVETQSAQFVLLVGEPGIGKSRLLLEFARGLDQEPDLVTWRQGRCLAYGEGVTFWPLSEILKAHIGVFDADDVVAVEAKLEAALHGDPDSTWLAQRLRPLLGLPTGEAPREESFAAWARFLALVASQRPTVAVVEDLHWASEAMLAFIEHLVTAELPVPLLLVATTRPDLLAAHEGVLTTAPSPNDGQRFRRLDLAPLSTAECAGLIASLLETELTSGATDRMVQLVGGNPLYAEQYVRLLLDRGLVVRATDGLRLEDGQEIPLPSTVQAVIAARLDALEPELKALLCDAAVVGESFWCGSLAALSGLTRTEIDEAMNRLMARHLIRPVATPSMVGETEYLFWHALARDVAYEQLPRRVRLEKHIAAADWLEEAAGERRDEFVEVLAHHYVAAAELAKAVGSGEQGADLALSAGRCLARAGELSRHTDAVTAERQLRRALDFLPTDTYERARVLFLLGEALSWQHPDRAIQWHERALPGLRLGDDPNVVADCLAQLAEFRLVSGEGDWRRPLGEAEIVLDEEKPTYEAVVALEELAVVHTLGTCDLEKGYDFATRSLSLADRLGLPIPVGALGFRAMVRCRLGDEGGLEDFRHAIDEAAAQGSSMWRVILIGNYANHLFDFKGPRAALLLYEEAAEPARRRGMERYVVQIRANAASCLCDLGEWDDALRAAREIAGSADLVEDLMSARATLATIEVARGRASEVQDVVDWLVASARAGSGQSSMIFHSYRAAAMAELALGRADLAVELLQEGLTVTGWNDWIGPESVRVALACGDIALAEQVRDAMAPTNPLGVSFLESSVGLLAEARGEPEVAVAHFAEAAARWHDLGIPFEEALALLGWGRCLDALGMSGQAVEPLSQAHTIFARLGARPALEETETLLGGIGSVPDVYSD